MKKIAIVTIQSRNYGNRLQNYAMQEVLQSLGFYVETLRRREKERNNIKRIVQQLLKTKTGNFIIFDKKINMSEFYINANEAPSDLTRSYDYFIVGSDQVWNPNYEFLGKSDLLYFAEKKKRIAYAASFGVTNIPLEKREQYIHYLKDFRSISVRESSGAEIIFDLINQRVPVVLDPTMLISATKWREISRKPISIPKHKYVLVYSLGNKNSKFMQKIKEINEDNLEILDILQNKYHGLDYPVGPAEFIYLIDHAEMVLTDSFHATVFSILFHKKVNTFNREGQNIGSRIVNLSELLGLNQYYNQEIFDTEAIKDYSIVDEKLELEREQSMDFLKRSLSIEV